MLNPDFTFEPYGGIGVQIELISLSGTEVNDKDFDSDGDFGFGFPFGARILIHHFFMGFEYNSIVKLWGGELDYYEDPTKANSKREKGVLSRESASYWAIHIGTIF